MPGVIYCFNTLADSKVIKCGHTQQSLSKRLHGYLGPSKPRMLIFSRPVKDSAFSERVMLTLMRQCRSLKKRLDLGNEWFEIVEDMESALGHLYEIANVVHLVNATPAMEFAPRNDKLTSVPHSQVLMSLRKYLAHMDAYVRDVAPCCSFASAKDLMDSFDASSVCPVFAEYLPFAEERLKVIEQRYLKKMQKN